MDIYSIIKYGQLVHEERQRELAAYHHVRQRKALMENTEESRKTGNVLLRTFRILLRAAAYKA